MATSLTETARKGLTAHDQLHASKQSTAASADRFGNANARSRTEQTGVFATRLCKEHDSSRFDPG